MANLVCAVCGAAVDGDAVWPWQCPRATVADPYHVLVPVPSGAAAGEEVDDPNPFVRFAGRLAGLRILPHEQRHELVGTLDAAVAEIEGHGFITTPLARADELSAALGFTARGGVWVKDETNNVAGSHKARHLGSIMLHLLACETRGVAPPGPRPALAIASCGNAALAAATLAAAVRWPLRVFVPPDGDPWVLGRLGELGATVVTCARRPDGPPGDPCLHRFREEVARGAIPF